MPATEPIVVCSKCGTKNRLPALRTGRPICGRCGAPLVGAMVPTGETTTGEKVRAQPPPRKGARALVVASLIVALLSGAAVWFLRPTWSDARFSFDNLIAPKSVQPPIYPAPTAHGQTMPGTSTTAFTQPPVATPASAQPAAGLRPPKASRRSPAATSKPMPLIGDVETASDGAGRPRENYQPAPPPVPTAPGSRFSGASQGPQANAAGIARACPWHPTNGQVLKSSIVSGGDNGGHVIEIRNGSGGNAIVKLRDVETRRTVLSFFVADSATASAGGIPDGTYLIQFAFGDDLDQTCTNFIADRATSEFPTPERLTTQASGTATYTSYVTYTLYAVQSGNVTREDIDPAAFDAD